MSWATTDDNIKLYFEEAGSGTPIVFVHEFGGDWRSWEPQMRHFARRHRCITFSARGFTPSDIPKDVDAYSQRRAVQDILCIMDAAGIDRACYFEDCDFMVDTLSGSSTMAQIMNLSGSAGGVVMLTGRTNFFGGTHWETSQSGTLYGTVPLPVAADMGKALEVAT